MRLPLNAWLVRLQACRALLLALVQQTAGPERTARLEALLAVLQGVTGQAQGRLLLLKAFQGDGEHPACSDG